MTHEPVDALCSHWSDNTHTTVLITVPSCLRDTLGQLTVVIWGCSWCLGLTITHQSLLHQSGRTQRIYLGKQNTHTHTQGIITSNSNSSFNATLSLQLAPYMSAKQFSTTFMVISLSLHSADS